MCTVSFIPLPKGFILTSSRDEMLTRKTVPPAFYNHNGKFLIYPRDIKGGGTWFAADQSGKIACLLNGAFREHTRKDKYRKSRGLILLESFEYDSFNDFYWSVDLKDIEPFTLLSINYSDQHELYELIWDGDTKYFIGRDIQQARIWSSSTLYNPLIQTARRKWFNSWLMDHKDDPEKSIKEFHTSRHGNTEQNDILMKRIGGLQTISITQFKNDGNVGRFYYKDLEDNEEFIKIIQYEQHMV
ncbi:MAG: NRDE family protein [Cyclobacteriaceae bacterium]|nr:NRDE family protein [Cyclobacteriaceae bacterium]